MLVSISGSQGSGKSSIINELRDMGFPTVNRKSSRSILSDWNVTLDQVNQDTELALRFQDEIIKRKFEDEMEMKLRHPGEVVFTERTFADLFTYTVVNLGKHNELAEWVNDYYMKCMEYQQIYSSVFYLRAGHFTPIDDGIRGISPHYSRMVDLTMLDFTQQMTAVSALDVIDTPNLSQRVNMIAVKSQARLVNSNN